MYLQSCSDITEAVALESSLGLYLKPVSKIKINVQLPKLKTPGQSISSWNVMEKIKAVVSPDYFVNLKALKITSSVIKFEGELESKTISERALARLRTTGSLKLSGFAEKLVLRAAHAPCSGPTRHDWEAFYRDAKGVNEMKPGERPDTIHLQDVPVRWFASSGKPTTPSEKVLKKAFESYGRIRRLEIPCINNDPNENTFGKKSFLQNDLLFEVYIQYEEYVEFSIAMDSLRGKKLLYKDNDGKVYAANIKVDFDRTNYLSDRCINKRAAESKKVNEPSSPSSNKQSCTDSKSSDTKPFVTLSSDVDRNKPSSKISAVSNIDATSKVVIKEETIHSKKKFSEKEATILLKELFTRAEKSERINEKSFPIEFSVTQPFRECGKKAEHQSAENEESVKRKKDSITNVKEFIKKERDITINEESVKKKRYSTALENCHKKVDLIHQKDYNKIKTKKIRDSPVHVHKDKSNKMKRESNAMKNSKEEILQSIQKDKTSSDLQYEKKKKDILLEQERILKEKLLRNLRLRELKKITESREKLRKELSGHKALKSVLAVKKK